jgi:signal transduction histidine kinase
MRREPFESFLSGLVLLVGLLGATLGLFLRYPSLRTPYSLPELKLALATVFMFAGALVAVLSGLRFMVEGRRFDLFLCGGFFVISGSWFAFTVIPEIAGDSVAWATAAGPTLGWAAIAAAPLVSGRIRRRRAGLLYGLALAIMTLVGVWLLSRALGNDSRAGVLAVQALMQLGAAIGFADRYRRRGEDLDQWLSLVSTLALFASLGLVFTPGAAPDHVARGDFLLLLAYGVLLVGVWRAIRASELGRVVAEERGRVAREIHDGLAQYLFTIATHVSMLESGADPDEILPRLKEASRAAQQEARYAILALSSAAGRAPFDTALRRYVDVLTADGALEVELEIDTAIRLGPDEQIEVFRIVQEGLANARKHAEARHAWVEIGARGANRYVSVRDDGYGFVPETSVGGQGLRNMRERAASIGGALSVRSAPGRGTSLEILLRT